MTAPSQPFVSRFLRFAAVGVGGFAVDAAVLSVLVYGLNLDPFSSRLISVLTAMTATYLLNRAFTFKDRDRSKWLRQYFAFVAANSVGAVVNYAAYTVVILLISGVALAPLIGAAVGAVAGLGVNFTASDRLVFRGAANRGGAAKT